MDQDNHLWEKIKAAKTHLFTETDFPSRYASGGLNVHHNEPNPLDETGPTSGSHNKATSTREFSIPSVVVTAPSPSPSEVLHHSRPSATPRQGTQADQGEIRYTCSRGTQTPRSPAVTAYNSGEETSSGSVSSLSTVVPVAVPSSSTKKKQVSFSQQAPQDIREKVSLGKPHLKSVKLKHSATSQEAASRPVNRMSSTDSSDEVMLRNGRFRASSGQWNAGAQSREASDQGTWSIQRGAYSSSKPGRTDSRSNDLNPKELALQRIGVNLRRVSASNSLSQGSAKKENQNVPMSPEEELEMLKKQILVNAHMNRFKEVDTPSINPEVLAKARDGPGTDPSSEIYCEFMRRASPQGMPSSSSKSSTGAQSASGQSKASQEEGTWVESRNASRVSYAESPAIYPSVEDGQVVLSSEPTPEVQLLIKAIGQEFGLGAEDEDVKQADQAPEHNWGDPFYVDWEFRSQACSGFPAFRDWFRRWFDGLVKICCHNDVYHQAFFDGTAHSDGMKSFVISDFGVPTTRLDVSDEDTRLHSHETVEGYCHNWARHIEREAEEKKARKARARAAYLESTKNNTPVVASPESTRPNYFLRPVEFEDIPELVVIMNWFIENSTLTLNVSPLEAEHVRERIETAKREMLPFLVAVERRPLDKRDSYPKGILGYAFATDTAGDRTAARFTAELELFVREEHRQRGIGKCLLNKIVEVCDPTFVINAGYFFESSWEDRPGYCSGGRRRLARLLFIISLPNIEREQYKWLWEWLQRDYGFEQQGLLKGVRVKFNRFYMVREVGSVDEDTFGN